jgi:SAM-dependent methyltransferase
MLSENYDRIFPLNMKLADMVQELTPAEGIVLDVGCATGTLLRELEKRGLKTAGMEYEHSLAGYMERTQVGDMRFLPYRSEVFDSLVCTGNTLAHADNHKDACGIMGEFARVLKKGGSAVVQVLNYEMILREKPDELPVIQNNGLRFERLYHYHKDHITFTGVLKVDETVRNSCVRLYPLTRGEIRSCAEENGLEVAAEYGGFDRSEFSLERSFAYIVQLRKH